MVWWEVFIRQRLLSGRFSVDMGQKKKDNKEYTKFQWLCLGPFIVTEKIGPSIVRLQTLEGVIDTYPVNAFSLKKYFVWKSWFNPVYRFGVLIFLFILWLFAWY